MYTNSYLFHRGIGDQLLYSLLAMAREETLAEVWYNLGHVALVISCFILPSDGTGGNPGRGMVQRGARGTGDQLFYSP